MNVQKVGPFKEKPVYKVLWVSNTPSLATGYAKVSRELCSRLANDPQFDVLVQGFQKMDPNGQPQQFMNFMNINIVPGVIDPNKREDYDKQVVWTAQQYQPDVILFLEDGFTLHNLGMKNLAGLPIKKIHYKPLDGEVVETTAIDVQRMVDMNVPMADFTRDELLKEGYLNVWDTVWHGIDLEKYYPVTVVEQRRLKQKHGFKEDDVVFYNYSRHNMRKHDQALLEALTIYFLKPETPKNSYAFLHIMDHRNVDVGDLEDFCNRVLYLKYGVNYLAEGRFIFNKKASHQNPASDDEMAEYMKMCDFVLSSSSGEGYGIIMAEAMATSKICIHAGYTTPKELLVDERGGIGSRGFAIPYQTPFYSSFNTRHAHVDPNVMAEKIDEVVRTDPAVVKQMGVNGRKFAERYLCWDNLAEEFKKVIKFVVG